MLLAGCLPIITLGACTESPPATTLPPAPLVDVVVSAVEWRFVPARVTAEAGSILTVELRNDGSIIHDWTVLSDPVVAEADYRRDLSLAGVTVSPGGVDVVTFEVPTSGEYQIICTIPGHFSSGMAGALVVTDS